MSRSGALRFARYAYPPNELGFCGPPGAREMLDPDAVRDIERRARQFEGVWSYLQLLADAAGVGDPLHADVVDAYWLGSDLLDAVSPAALVARLEDRFRGQVGGTWREAAARARPHHSFQVFEVYPWSAMLRAGRPSGPAVSILDRCRIRVGRVLAVLDGSVTVTSRPLVWDGATLAEGAAVVEQARWSVDGRSLIDEPEAGQQVALHWDWVCETLGPEQAERLRGLEQQTRRGAGLSGCGLSPDGR
jgi:hypothetical protein